MNIVSWRSIVIAFLAAVVATALWSLPAARFARADVVVNNGAEVETLDPANASGSPEGRVLRAIFEGLTVKDPVTSEPLPGMAEAWEISADGLTYTFFIRPDAVWTNGDPVTASDFEFSWRRLLDPSTGAKFARFLWIVDGVDPVTHTLPPGKGLRALDERTFQVKLSRPVAFFLELTSFYALYPINRRSLAEAQTAYPDDEWRVEWLRPEHLVTNGPFRIESRRVNDRIRLVKNEHYWDAQSVALDTVDFLAVESAATSLNLYLSGDADWIDRIPTSAVARLLGREDFVPVPYLGTYFLRVNVVRPPLDDANVRRALALCIDRKRVTDFVTKAGQLPAYAFVPPGLPKYAPVPFAHRAEPAGAYASTFEQDCAEARRLLADAGFGATGRPFPAITIQYNTSEEHRDVMEVVADSWRRHLGLEVTTKKQEWKAYLDAQSRIDFDVSRSGWIADYPDPQAFLELFVTDGENNQTGWSDAEYDALIARAEREPDRQARVVRFQQAEAVLMRDLPVIPIYSYVTKDVINPRVGGVTANPLDEHFPKWWYLRSDAELDALRAHRTPGRFGGGHTITAPGPTDGRYPRAALGGRFPAQDPRAAR
jgi:oligopeptide transport system substrate-binding protein